MNSDGGQTGEKGNKMKTRKDNVIRSFQRQIKGRGERRYE